MGIHNILYIMHAFLILYLDPGYRLRVRVCVCVFCGACNLRFVRLKGLRQVHPDRPKAAFFSTESYGITADLELDPESVQANQQIMISYSR